jgi:N-acetylmuramoyl-L-alanine amidase
LHFRKRKYACFGAIVIINIMAFGSIHSVQAGEVVATDIRIGADKAKTRFVIDISDDIKFSVHTLSNPYRVVIDLPKISWRLPGNVARRNPPGSTGIINHFRYGHFQAGLSRVVLDLDAPAEVRAAFLLPPVEGKRYRLVLDLIATSRKNYLTSLRRTTKMSNKPAENSYGAALSGILPPGRKPEHGDLGRAIKTAVKKPVIIIDPGHGGIDPGSTSGRIFEKHITLAIAKVIQNHLNSLGRYKVRLTRGDDSFIPLRKRIAIARARKADLFISLHADAIKNRAIRGLSVYTLSEKASDKEAADLAEKENKVDLIAGIDLSTKSKEVTNILIDLAQRDAMNNSSRFAAGLVTHIRKFTKTLSNTHRFAGFAVLKAPDVPSILIEMGFLSNRADEKALLNPRYRAHLARSIGNAIDDYFSSKH